MKKSIVSILACLAIVVLSSFYAIGQSNNRLQKKWEQSVDFDQIGEDNSEIFRHSVLHKGKIYVSYTFQEYWFVGEMSHATTIFERHNLDGSLDSSFGEKGRFVQPAMTCAETPTFWNHFIIDKQDNPYLIGSRGSDLIITKLLASGKQDVNFGTKTLKAYPDTISGLTPFIYQNSKGEKFVVVSYLVDYVPNIKKVHLYRLLDNGTIDPSFQLPQEIHDKVGKVELGFPRLAIGPGDIMYLYGSVPVSMNSVISDMNQSIFLLKVKQDGSFDSGFGNNSGYAKLATRKGIYHVPNACIVDSSHNLYIAGYGKDFSNKTYGFVKKVNSLGAGISTFGNMGDIFLESSIMGDLYLSKDSLWTAGTFRPDGNGTSIPDYLLAIRKWNTSGVLNSSYGNNGVFLGARIADGAAPKLMRLPDMSFTVANDNYRPSSKMGMYVELQSVLKNGGYNLNYGNNGILQIATRYKGIDNATGIVKDKRGNILLSGPAFNHAQALYGLCRFTSTGLLDMTFGTNGKTTADMGQVAASSGTLINVSVDNEQNTYTTGTGYNRSSILKMNSTGLPDNTFGEQGKLHPAAEYVSSFWEDETLVIAGSSVSPSTGSDLTFVHVKPNGHFDSSYCGTGRLVIPLSGTQRGNAVLPLGNKEYIIGTSTDYVSNFIKLKSNGTIDSAFGKVGKIVLKLGDNSVPTKMRSLATGNFVALIDSYLAKFRKNGVLDSNFATNGSLFLPTYPGIRDFVTLPDSSLLVLTNTECEAVVMKITAKGRIDSSFGDNGSQLFEECFGNTLYLDDQGGLYIAGRRRGDFYVLSTVVPIVTSLETPISAEAQSLPYEIRNDLLVTKESGQVSVYDFSGKLILSKEVAANESIRLQGRSFFLVHMISAGRKYSSKVGVMVDSE